MDRGYLRDGSLLFSAIVPRKNTLNFFSFFFDNPISEAFFWGSGQAMCSASVRDEVYPFQNRIQVSNRGGSIFLTCDQSDLEAGFHFGTGIKRFYQKKERCP